jgi:hypothetical protein
VEMEACKFSLNQQSEFRMRNVERGFGTGQ